MSEKVLLLINPFASSFNPSSSVGVGASDASSVAVGAGKASFVAKTNSSIALASGLRFLVLMSTIS
jgi:hypothetical protein